MTPSLSRAEHCTSSLLGALALLALSACGARSDLRTNGDACAGRGGCGAQESGVGRDAPEVTDVGADETDTPDADTSDADTSDADVPDVVSLPDTGTAIVCGGLAGFPCPVGEWCDLGAQCLGADGEGTCETVPTECSPDCPRVCGCDHALYCNACEASAAEVAVVSGAACTMGTACSDQNLACAVDEWCSYETGGESSCRRSGVGACVKIPTVCPTSGGGICGCDGNAYSNDCLAHQASADVASSGQACGG